MIDKTLIDQLRQPFTPESVRFKVQSRFGDAALIVAYIDARLVSERLNAICPADWWDEYENDGAICHLTVFGVTRTDRGVKSQTEGEKGIYSDSFKRAAVKFGVGVSLYSIPKIILKTQGDGGTNLKTKDGKITGITDRGLTICRTRYRDWLNDTGAKAFGPALDHGDTEESVGDIAPEDEPTTAPEDVQANVVKALKGKTLKPIDLIFQNADLPALTPRSKAELEKRIGLLTTEQATAVIAEATRG